MTKKILYRTNKQFITFLNSINFKHRSTFGDNIYYSNLYGNQIKVNFKTKLITLIDKAGFTLARDKVFNQESILTFSELKN